MRRNNGRRFGVIALIIVVAAIGFWLMKRQQALNQQPVIKTAKVERNTVTTTVSATGTLQPLSTVQLSSNVGGQVVYLGVDEGDRVKADQVIARIDPRDTQTALEQAQADVVGAQAKITQSRENLTLQQLQNAAQIQSAQQGVETARLRLAQAEKQATLQIAVSGTSIEQAQQALNSARTKLAQAQAQAELQPKLTAAAIAQAQSNLAQAKSSYNQTKNALSPQKVAAAKSAFDQAKANFDFAQKDNTRQQQLLAKGFIPRSTMEASDQSFQVAKANLENAQKKLDTVTDEAQQDVDVAQSRVDQAQAALDNAKANAAQDALKQQDVDAASAAVKEAESGLVAAKANKAQDAIKAEDAAAARSALKQAQDALSTARANLYQEQMKQRDITQAMASAKHSEASLTNAQTQLGYTTITAPRDGIVVKKYVEAGSIVAAGRTSISGSSGAGVALVDIADISHMYVLVNVDETDIAQISRGQEVDITIDAFANDMFRGHVSKISPQTVVNQNVTTIPVQVEIEAPDLRMKPGMNATCDFITARKKNVLTVPLSAVKDGDAGSTVTVMKDGKQVVKPVEVGLTDNDKAEIISGLQEGDVVITSIDQPGKKSSTSTGGTSGTGGRQGNRSPMRGMPFG